MFNSGLPKIPQSVITDTFATDYERNFLNSLQEKEMSLMKENMLNDQNRQNQMDAQTNDLELKKRLKDLYAQE